MSFFEVWGILWALSLPFVPYVRGVVRRRRYQRCLARIERLEIELGYRKAPATWSGLLRDMAYGPGQIVELVDRGLPRIYAPAGTMLPSNLRAVDQGGAGFTRATETVASKDTSREV